MNQSLHRVLFAALAAAPLIFAGCLGTDSPTPDTRATVNAQVGATLTAAPTLPPSPSVVPRTLPPATSTPGLTPIPFATRTPTPTPTPGRTLTPTSTPTPIPTPTLTPTPTPTRLPTPQPTATPTPQPTATSTPVLAQRFSLQLNGITLVSGQSLVTIANGTVQVVPAPGPDSRYAPGTQVFLHVLPVVTNSTITWSGVDTTLSADQTSITMTRDRQVMVSVTPTNFLLTVNGALVTGPQLSLALADVFVSPPPDPVDGRYRPGTQVNLTASPVFLGNPPITWTAAGITVMGSTVTVTMRGDVAVSLVITTTSYALLINNIPVTGSLLPVSGGDIAISPTPNALNNRYYAGTQVTLTSQPTNAGDTAVWTGIDGDQTVVNPATVTMGSDKNIQVAIVPHINTGG